MSLPLRTCIGCSNRDTQRNMLRIVRSCGGDGPTSQRILVDVRRDMPGRGAWLHPSVQCLQQAVRRNAFARAFKTVCGASQVQAFAEQLQQRLEAEERTAGPM